ncbi:hypothetical protein H0H92_001530 [Tricholoma furcatifolium]|nr:hypothetical protein H0H92_001530 [Tricholoma furcatifolium]
MVSLIKGSNGAFFPSILQLVSSPSASSPDFESMEDVHDFPSLAAGSEAIPIKNNVTPLAATGHSFHKDSLPFAVSESAANLHEQNDLSLKKLQLNRAPSDATGRSSGFTKPPIRSKSCSGTLRRHRRLPDVDEALPSLLGQQDAPFSDVSHSPLRPVQRPSFAARHSHELHQRRRSLDLGSNMIQASIRRLIRSPSLRTAGDKSLPIEETQERHIRNLRAEPQLSGQQKVIALRRARKIAQVFGSEAPLEIIQGKEHSHHLSTIRRSSLSTVPSIDAPPSTGPTRHRSNSESSAILAVIPPSASSLEDPTTPSDLVSIDSSPSLFPSSSFSERRRRAAKLSHFFGVSYHDIPHPASQKISYSSTSQKSSSAMASRVPILDVDVKVTGRRFWGLADGEMKSAEVADVIHKLRGLKAA